MSVMQSMGRAFRPSRCAPEEVTYREDDQMQVRESRIRTYSQRVRLRLPLFEPQAVQAEGDLLTHG